MGAFRGYSFGHSFVVFFSQKDFIEFTFNFMKSPEIFAIWIIESPNTVRWHFSIMGFGFSSCDNCVFFSTIMWSCKRDFAVVFSRNDGI